MTDRDGLAGYFEANRANWDERAASHLNDRSGIYRLDDLKRGEDVLGPVESTELGDIDGKRLGHFQCHFGIDTICLARRGADVVGIDFSPVAIAAARELAAELGVNARFVEGNVYDAPALIGPGLDGIYTSWGTIGWLPDLRGWAEAIAGCLAPGGFFYMVDAHPTLYQLEERDGRLEVFFDWKTPADRPIVETEVGSYAGDGRAIVNRTTYGWNHPLSEVFAELAAAGLKVEYFHEHEMIPWRAFPSMRRDGAMFVQAEGQMRIPLAFSLRATKL